MRGLHSVDESQDFPAAPRGGEGFFLLIVGVACCAVLIMAALGSL
jgi:hypothetical protein